ncbi:MAG TPA: 6,7-dimethyl-8-ribityllumazine synthase [Vicinamibacterales bacterium]|nr:6,7-dimethyl-8-ribityllumazine synthase [Vicinamibacterales bacterium]
MRHAGEAAAPGDASSFRFAVVVARFNAFVTDRLRDGAVAALREAGARADAVDVLAVPGAFEIPQAARAAAATGRYDAVVCLGCLIRGATPHFDYIASAAAHGITAVATATGIPCAFGVLTTDTREQALERAGDGPDNKGREAAAAAIEMAALCRAMGRPSGIRA